MALRPYNSPGVTVSEVASPALAPLLANPSIVAIVGPARGEQSGSERLLVDEVTTTTTGAHTLPVTTLNVSSTAGFEDSGSLEIGTQLVSYTGKTATSFTGASGGTGSVTNGTTVRQNVRQTLRHTGIDLASVTVKLAATGETIGAGNYNIVQLSDPDTGTAGDETYSFARRTQPTAAPTVAAAGSGTLTGDYRYAVSFVHAGGETGVGPTSNTVTNNGANSNNLTDIPLGPQGTTQRNIYREKVVGGTGQGLRLVATIADNTVTALSNENTSDTTASVAATPKTGISDNGSVIVSYEYTDQNYNAATMMSDFDDIIDKYGDPFDANGNIGSKLSFAARLAFINGASDVMLVATTVDSQQAYEAALAKLELEPNVRFVVTTGGTSAINTTLVSHVNKMNAQGFYRIGIMGEDGVANTVSMATLRANAQAINNEAIQIVSPPSFVMQNPATGRNLTVGGQYAAAAVAGMWAGRDVHVPLTRKSVGGFSAVNIRRSAAELALDSAAGLLVIEERGTVLRIRHSVTTAVTDVNKREGSVVRAKYDMAHRLKEALDGSVVGVVAPISMVPTLVIGTVAGLLDLLVIESVINSYSDVKARVLDQDPTTVEVRYSYVPAYPINNIEVRFQINTQTGEFTQA